MLSLLAAGAVAASLLQARAVGSCGCAGDETCCEDSAGYACCVNQVTACAPNTGGFPARCCPKWTVGCTAGSVGCCDPARAWQRLESATKAAGESTTSVRPEDKVYALMVGGLVGDGLHTLELSGSGAGRGPRKVSGAAAEWFASYYGEATRVFAFNRKAGAFQLVDIVRSGNATVGLQLISIEAATGASTVTKLQVTPDEVEYPVGQAYDAANEKLVFSLESPQKVRYFSVNGAAVAHVGSLDRSAAEDAPSFYAAYASLVHKGTWYRVGYQFESKESTPGVLRTTVGGQAVWTPVQVGTIPQNGEFYESLDALSDGSFASLSMSTQGYRLVRWNPFNSTAAPAVAASFEGTTPPTAPDLGRLGYIATDMAGDVFTAVAWRRGHGEVREHKWALLRHDFSTNTSAVRDITPEMHPAASWSLSGVGAA